MRIITTKLIAFNNNQYRWIILFGTIMYASWANIYNMLNPNLHDSPLFRAILGIPLCVLCIVSAYNKEVERRLESIFFFFAILATVVHYYFVYQNKIAIEYNIGSILLAYCLISIIQSGLQKTILLAINNILILGISFHMFGWDLFLPKNSSMLHIISVGTLSFFSYVTHHVFEKVQRAYERQKNENNELRRSSSLGQMAGGVAHEINTPLTTLTLSAEIMEHSLANGNLELAQKHSKKIINESKKISYITSNLRRLTNEDLTPTKEKVDLKQLLNHTVNVWENKLTEEGIHLKHNLSKAKGEKIIQANYTAIKNAINDLITNSIEALEKTKNKEIHLNLTEDSSFYNIYIKDNGSGIPKEKAEHIFDPFYTTKDIGQGMGISLSSNRAQIRSYGGKLFLDEDQKLTTFGIQFPKSHLDVKKDPSKAS